MAGNQQLSKQGFLQEVNDALAKKLEQKKDAMLKSFNDGRFMQECMTVLADTKGIEKVKPHTVVRVLMKGATLGLSFANKECYAIPFGDSLQFIIDYKGNRKLALKYSIKGIKDIPVFVVRKGDNFTYKIEPENHSFVFEPIAFNDEDIVGVFGYAIFNDGTIKMTQPMSRKEIEDIRDNYSKQPKGQLWVKSFSEACKKTFTHRICKELDLEFENEEQKQAFDDGAGCEFKKDEKEIIDTVKVPDVMPDTQVNQIIEDFKTKGVIKPASELVEGDNA